MTKRDASKPGDTKLAAILQPLAYGNAVLWACVTAVQAAANPSFVGTTLLWCNLAVVALSAGIGVLVRFYPPPARYSHAILSIVAMANLADILYRTYLDIPPNFGPMMWILLIGCIVYDPRWFVLLESLALAGGLLVGKIALDPAEFGAYSMLQVFGVLNTSLVFYIRGRALRRQVAAEEEVRSRDAILSAVADISGYALSSENLQSMLERAVIAIGNAAGASRAYIYENRANEDGVHRVYRKSMWSAPEAGPSIPKIFDGLSYSQMGFPEYANGVGADQLLIRKATEMPDPFRGPLAAQGILSLTIAPITVGKNAWGFIGLTNCVSPDRGSSQMADALRTAARIVGGLIEADLSSQSLKASEARFRDLSELVPMGIFEVDRSGTITYANRAACETLGYELSEIKDTLHLLDFVIESDRPLVMAKASRNAPQDGKDEYTARHKSGRMFPMFTKSVPILKDGNVMGFRGILLDISERKSIEESLRNNEQRYRALFQNSTDAVYLTDFEGQFIEMNQAAYEMLGYDPATGELPRFADLLDPEQMPAAMQNVRSIVQFGRKPEGAPGEFRLRRKDGAYIDVDVNGSLVYEDGKPASIQGIARDISMRKRAEHELRLARERAEAANTAKSMFLANMSHEIRTPMNGVIGLTSLLLDTELTGDQRDMMETLRQSGEALLSLINDILDYSKIEAGKLTIEKANFDLRGTIAETMGLLSAHAQERNVALKSEIDPALPRAVAGDSLRIGQILLNLCGNALKFTERGEVAVSAAIESETPEGLIVRLSVRDSGIGISVENVATLFDSFTQADASTSRKYGGTGLGLAISKQLAELMGGAIGVESRVGEGSTFWVTVPMGRVAADAMPEPSAPIAVPDRRERGPGLKILLVEDNAVNRKVATQFISKFGHEVAIAENGLEAVEAIGREFYDLVLMDCQMPEMDGYEATKTIRQNGRGRRHIPIVAMTANAMTGDREKCLDAGMDDYITKPIRIEDLERVFMAYGASMPAHPQQELGEQV